MLSMEWDEEVYREVLLEEGREEGRVKGRKERALEIAYNMKQEGVDKALIIKTSGLSEQEVDSL